MAALRRWHGSEFVALLVTSFMALGCGDSERESLHGKTCAPGSVACESEHQQRVCAADGRSWSLNECTSAEACVDGSGCTSTPTACKPSAVCDADGGTIAGEGGGGGDITGGSGGSAGALGEAGGASDPACQDRPAGTPCGEGKICISETCDISRCGDGYIDRAAGEECEPSNECSGDCRLLPCVDPGPCLVAKRDENGVCVSEPGDDDTPCEDGNACTADDRCQNGVCSGTAIQQKAALRGDVQTFGASPPMWSWNEGVAAFMSDDRILFLESKSWTDSVISLVQTGGTALNVLSTAKSQAGYFRDINWVYRPLTHIVPLNATDFAVIDGHDTFWGTPRTIEIFEIDNDELISHGVTQMPDTAPIIYGAAGRDDALWTCGPSQIDTYAYDSTSKQLKLSQQLGLNVNCNALALSTDGQTLYMATKGARVIDVSADPKPGDPANVQVPEICPSGTAPRDPSSTVPETCTLLANYTLSDVQVSADFLAALTTDNVGDLGSVVAVSTHDSSSVQVMEQDVLSGGPVAIALADDRLFVEWDGDYSDGWMTLDVGVHPLGSASTQPLAMLPVRDDCCGGEPWTLLSFVARGDLAVLQPWRRVVRFDEAGQALGFVTATEHGSLGTLVPSSSTEVAAVGPYESHWIDVSDPDAPRIVSGGLNLSPSSGDFQLLTPGNGNAATLANTTPGILTFLSQKSAHERFSILDTSSAPQATELGSFWIDGEPSNDYSGTTQIGGSPGRLFQVHEDTGTSFRVRRYAMAAGIGLQVQELSPDLETIVEIPGVADAPSRGSWAFAANASGSEILLVEARYETGTTTVRTVATWLSVDDNDVSVLATGQFAEKIYANGVAMFGDRGAFIDTNNVALLRRDGSSITQTAYLHLDPSTDRQNPIIMRILGFDGERTALSVHHWTQLKKSQHGAEIYDSNLSLLTEYDTSEEVQSMLTVGTKLVFGMNSAVSVAAAYCP